ncbi:hypothetical protein [Arenimonas donghaensis]|nr:hypothetical protein [Arenimonas donghaensis]
MAQAAGWDIQTFRVVDADPRSGLPLDMNPTIDFSGDEAFLVALMETYFNDVGREYQALGLAAPSLPVFDDGQGGKAYAVHLNDYPDQRRDGSQQTRARYATDNLYIEIDASRALSGSELSEQLLEDIAHELFHAVQRSYRGNPGATHGDWIIEGQAQALGMDTARKLRGADVHAGTQDDYRLGGREYFLSLPTQVHDETYRTASFWRYLAEALPSGYGYLAALFAVPFETAGENADLLWLDEGLRSSTGEGLALHYANFVVSVAGYVPGRLTRAPSGTPEAAREKWLERLFGSCPTGNLTERSPVGVVRSRLQKNAARCFNAYIEPSVTASASAQGGSALLRRVRSRRNNNQVDLLVRAQAPTVAALEALSIGHAGSKASQPANVAPAADGDGYTATWGFGVEAGKPQTFIVSNIAGLPTTSQEQEVYFDLLTSSAHMTGAGSGLSGTIGGPVNLRFDRFPSRDILATDVESTLKAGIDRPCMLRLLMTQTDGEARFALQVDHAGPIRPGSFSVTRGQAPEKTPGNFIGYFSFGTGRDTAAYGMEGGTVELTAFGPHLVQGKASVLGRLPARGYGDAPPAWPETLSVRTEFTIIPRVNLDSPLFKHNYCFE